MKKTLKKIYIIMAVLLLLINHAHASVLDESRFFQDYLRFGDSYAVEFTMNFVLNKLYPFDKKQTEIFAEAVKGFNMACSIEQNGDISKTSSSLKFADKDIFFQGEVQNKDDFYTMNSLLDKKILQNKGKSFMELLLNQDNSIDENTAFYPYKAKANHNISIPALLGLMEKGNEKKCNVKIRDIGTAKSCIEYSINNNDIENYQDIILSIINAGIDKAYIESIKPVGNWEIKDYFNQDKQRIAVYLKGMTENAQGLKRNVKYNISFTENMAVYKLEAEAIAQNNKKDYYKINLKLEEDKRLFIYSLFEIMNKDMDKSQNINCNLKYGKEEEKRSISGEYGYIEETKQGKKLFNNGYNIYPQIIIDKLNDVYNISGKININTVKNDVKEMDADIVFGEAVDQSKPKLLCKTMVESFSKAGIENSLKDIDTETSGLFKKEYKNIPLQIIKNGNWKQDYIKALSDELISNAASNILKAMLENPELSTKLLSMGMTSEDWNKFLQNSQNKGE